MEAVHATTNHSHHANESDDNCETNPRVSVNMMLRKDEKEARKARPHSGKREQEHWSNARDLMSLSANL
jgi:hypothetical protein